MNTITCPSCGLAFGTTATTNTRCRRCRKVVNVGSGTRSARPKQLWFLVLLLACGHDSGYYDEDVQPDEAAGYLWACEECGTEHQEVRRVLGGLPMEQLEAMSEEEAGAFLVELESVADVVVS